MISEIYDMKMYALDSNHPYELSIIIPCYNEEKTVGICVKKAIATITKFHINAEIIVADNYSEDNSQQIALEAGAKLVKVDTKGYGGALQGGIEEASGKFVIMGDADDSYDFLSFMPILEKLREGYDLVLGNRFSGGIKPGAMPVLHKYLGNPFFSFLAKKLFRSTVNDVYCGLRGFNLNTIKELKIQSTGMEFAIEMVVKSTIFNKKITEIPIILHPDGRDRKPHLKTWSDGWRTLRFMLLYAPKWIFLIPGGSLFFLGVLLGIPLTKGPIIIGNIGFDVSSLLVCSMSIILGVQLISFFLIAKLYGSTTGLLPHDSNITKLLKSIKIEIAAFSGIISAVIGFTLLTFGLYEWQLKGFGAMSYPNILRKVIPAVTLITLGMHIFFTSFLIGLFGLSKK
jgi:glycosyltransferase involved in cell wall biosynthesis